MNIKLIYSLSFRTIQFTWMLFLISTPSISASSHIGDCFSENQDYFSSNLETNDHYTFKITTLHREVLEEHDLHGYLLSSILEFNETEGEIFHLRITNPLGNISLCEMLDGYNNEIFRKSFHLQFRSNQIYDIDTILEFVLPVTRIENGSEINYFVSLSDNENRYLIEQRPYFWINETINERKSSITDEEYIEELITTLNSTYRQIVKYSTDTGLLESFQIIIDGDTVFEVKKAITIDAIGSWIRNNPYQTGIIVFLLMIFHWFLPEILATLGINKLFHKAEKTEDNQNDTEKLYPEG